MSAFAYGALSRTTTSSEPVERITFRTMGEDNVVHTESRATAASAYIATLAALVPAEVLALHAFMVQIATTTTKDETGQAVTTITDPSALKATFWVCVGLSVLLYITGRALTGSPAKRWTGWDLVRALIPSAAFVLWTIIQKSTAFDAIWPNELSEGSRALIGAAGAVTLGALAAVLAKRSDS